MKSERMRVRVADGDTARVAFNAPDGTLVFGRFVARDSKGEPMPDGEVLELTARNRNDLMRAIADGHLVIVDEE